MSEISTIDALRGFIKVGDRKSDSASQAHANEERNRYHHSKNRSKGDQEDADAFRPLWQ